jgi:hypothetical protein
MAKYSGLPKISFAVTCLSSCISFLAFEFCLHDTIKIEIIKVTKTYVFNFMTIVVLLGLLSVFIKSYLSTYAKLKFGKHTCKNHRYPFAGGTKT